jgi:hypothetical protein
MRLKYENGGMLWVEGGGLCRSWSIVARNFSWKRRFSAKAQNIADIVLPSSRPAGSAARCGLALRFEPRLELGNELVKAGFHPTRDRGPRPVLQRGNGDSQFEFDSILGLEVTTAVAADDF